MDGKDIGAYMILSVSLLLVFGGGPLCTIWSLNTLFNLSIPYAFDTWLAAGWLMVLFWAIRFPIKWDD